jgi:hypothetical protein
LAESSPMLPADFGGGSGSHGDGSGTHDPVIGTVDQQQESDSERESGPAEESPHSREVPSQSHVCEGARSPRAQQAAVACDSR